MAQNVLEACFIEVSEHDVLIVGFEAMVISLKFAVNVKIICDSGA